MWELSVRLDFSAAHQLRNYQGRCEQMHGHNWVVEIRVRSRVLDGCGLAMDFGEIRAAARRVLDTLDHRLLNEQGPFLQVNPSAENIAAYIFREMAPSIPDPCTLHAVTVYETPEMSATYREAGHEDD